MIQGHSEHSGARGESSGYSPSQLAGQDSRLSAENSLPYLIQFLREKRLEFFIHKVMYGLYKGKRIGIF